MTGETRPEIAGIDTHAHVFRRGLPLAEARRYAPDYDAPLAAYLQRLDAAGLSHGVLVQPSFLGADNGFMLDALRACPVRLRGVAMVRPDAGDAELDELIAGGVVGIRFNLISLPLPDYSKAPWPGLLRKLAQRALFVEIHRHAADLNAILPPLLDAGLHVVVDHFGRPDPALGADDPGFRKLLTLTESGRVWVKLSASYRNGSSVAQAAAMAATLADAFGPQRLLWGSDWPHTQFEGSTDHAGQFALVERLLPEEEARRAVLVDNPARLYRFR